VIALRRSPRPVRGRVLLTVLVLAAAGCWGESAGGTQAPAPVVPELPPLALREVLPGLEQLAAAGPPAPADERLRELRDLLETAYLPGYAPARSAAMAQRALEEVADFDWILEDALVHHEDATLRAQCAFLLGSRGRSAALPLLLMRVKYEKDAVVQTWVIGALARLGCHGALDQLAALMDRADSAQRAGVEAIEILRAAGRDPGEAPSYAELQAMCVELFRDWKDRGAVPAPAEAPDLPVAVPAFEELDPLLRSRLAWHLSNLSEFQLRPVDDCRFVFMRLGVLGLPVLELCIPAAEPYPRNHALEIVLALGRPAERLGPLVLPMLGDPLVGSVAARALGAIGHRPALPHLIAWLGAEAIETRAAAAAGLGLMGDLAAHGPLAERLFDANEILDVRVEAALAIARLDPGRRFLIERLSVGDYHAPTLLEHLDAIDLERARARSR
jgi:HEAT repeat protein